MNYQRHHLFSQLLSQTNNILFYYIALYCFFFQLVVSRLLMGYLTMSLQSVMCCQLLKLEPWHIFYISHQAWNNSCIIFCAKKYSFFEFDVCWCNTHLCMCAHTHTHAQQPPKKIKRIKRGLIAFLIIQPYDFLTEATGQRRSSNLLCWAAWWGDSNWGTKWFWNFWCS